QMSLFDRTAHELGEMLRRREVSAVEVTEAVLKRVESVDPVVKAYLTTTPELARAMARAVDSRLQRGEELPPLAGIPMGLKDNFSTTGVRTTCASKMLEHYVPPFDCTVYQ